MTDWRKRIQGTWATPGKASVLVGGQFGSEGKGLAAAYLAERAVKESFDRGARFIATTNAGAQAGHTTKYEDGREFVCFHLPTTSIVMQHHGLDCLTYINAGSIIDLDTLFEECRRCGLPLDDVIVHPRAAIIKDENRQEERHPASSLCLTGRNFPAKLLRHADIATDMTKLKHHYDDKFLANPGIDF